MMGLFFRLLFILLSKFQESKKIDDDDDDDDTDADTDVSNFVLEKQPQQPYLSHYIAECT